MGENESLGVEKIRFSELTEEPSNQRIDQKMLAEIPIEAVVVLGKTKITLREIMDLAEGSIIDLNKNIGEPLDIKVGGQSVAQGEVVAVDDCYAVRITKVNIK